MGSRYDYICSSEDRPHYDTEDIIPFGTYLRKKPNDDIHKYPRRPGDRCAPGEYPVPVWPPHVTSINITNKTEVVEEVTDERIQTVVDDYVPTITENVIEEIGDNITVSVTAQEVDEAVDEIYGGSASDMIPEGGS